MTTPYTDFGKCRELGWKIYNEKIKDLVEPQETGKLLVIDVTTEDYVVGRSLGCVTQELLDRRPDAIVYTIRIGHPAVYRLPGMRLTSKEQTSND